MTKKYPKIKKKLIIFILIIVGLFSFLFYLKDIITNPVYFKNGVVDIALSEYNINNDGEKIKWQEKENIVPGEKISRIAEILCEKNSEDCYIRAKVDVICKNIKNKNNKQIVLQDFFNIDTGKWLYCNEDGYWYYKERLTKSSEGAILFTEIYFPEESINSNDDLIEIFVTAEAVQTQKIIPNFENNSTQPWPGITENDIEDYEYSNNI